MILLCKALGMKVLFCMCRFKFGIITCVFEVFALMLIFYTEKIYVFVVSPLLYEYFYVCKVNMLRCDAVTFVVNIWQCRLLLLVLTFSRCDWYTLGVTTDVFVLWICPFWSWCFCVVYFKTWYYILRCESFVFLMLMFHVAMIWVWC